MCYAEDYFFQEAEADLPQGTSAIVPINDVDHIGLSIALYAMDVGEDDEVGGEAVLESSFCMVLFMQVGIVDIEIGDAGFEAFGEIAV